MENGVKNGLGPLFWTPPHPQTQKSDLSGLFEVKMAFLTSKQGKKVPFWGRIPTVIIRKRGGTPPLEGRGGVKNPRKRAFFGQNRQGRFWLQAEVRPKSWSKNRGGQGGTWQTHFFDKVSGRPPARRGF